MRRLRGASYETKHCESGKIDKRHAMDLSPVPPELQAVTPVDGPDNRYGQLYHNITKDAYKAAGIDGFLSHCSFDAEMFEPSAAAAAAVHVGSPLVSLPRTPTLADLNGELDDWSDASIKGALESRSRSALPPLPAISMAAAKPAEAVCTPSPSELMALMVPTKDRLFFICLREKWRLV